VVVVEFHLLRLEGLTIYQQLQIEEALLRADTRNWCLLHSGVAPAIVMGISGQPEQLIDEKHRQQQALPVIRRFSGGGTVVVDEHTCFASWIVNTDSVGIDPYPEPIMQWSAAFYQPLFPEIDFQLRESDYVIGGRKFGGNAQSICRRRWLHHTSFLWHYTAERMAALKLPMRAPEYRSQRSHADFLCCLRDIPSYSSHPRSFLDAIEKHLHTTAAVVCVTADTVTEILERPHRRALEHVIL
jgi:lipoate-protein ligase A